MSMKLVRAIFESDLPPHLKATAAALATFGHNGGVGKDGQPIFAGMERVAWLLGKTERRVRADVAELLALGCLELIQANNRGGRGDNSGKTRSTSTYRLPAEHLPTRESYEYGCNPGKRRKPGRHCPPLCTNTDSDVRLSEPDPAADVRVSNSKPGHGEQETRTSEAQNPDASVSRSKISDRSDLIENKRSTSTSPKDVRERVQRQLEERRAVSA